MQPFEHRFCASCGTLLPKELPRRPSPKVTRWFSGVPVHPDDSPTAMLRVSRYLDEFEIETGDGSVRIPSHHVRFSVWVEDRVTCAVSIPDSEAQGLADFLLAEVSDGDERRRVPDAG
ncbi:MAG TPA: hypothetical protein VGR13_07895 [Actinomycetota bacterium]|nr:hypothetical protein [Actinomycetota bacterium]